MIKDKLKMVVKERRKSMVIRPSGRSSDYISPSFGHGCLYDCSYCYMKRHKPAGLTIASNTEEILTEINNHAAFATVDKPNQTHKEYITYDISCNEDFALHRKYHEWEKVFKFFKEHPTAMATLATKNIPYEFLSFKPEGKVRIRMSLMPEKLRATLEKGTASIERRLSFIYELKKAGYDVHLNFSPVVYYDGWLEDYKELFELVNKSIDDKHKPDVLAEVIFLTHNENKHLENVGLNKEGEDLLWNPILQESKISQYGGENVRYKYKLKEGFIKEFKQLHEEIIPWNTIRYIF